MSTHQKTSDTAVFAERLSKAHQNLTTLDQRLREIYSINPSLHAGPVPKDLKGLKDWCSGPLETSHIQSRKHLGYLGSRFLARKILPSPPDTQLGGYFQKLSREPAVNEGFAATMRDIVPKLFKKGWDRRYQQIVQEYLPSLSSSTEMSRKNGGARAWWQANGGQDMFVKVCMGEVELDLPALRNVAVVDDAGKIRVVTVGSAIQHVLGPLHILLYEVLTGKEWLLRGDAKASCFKEFTTTSGEIFVSGDYESATDNFNRLHSKLLLVLVLSTASFIPEAIKTMAVSRLDPGLLRDPKDGTLHIQCNGQLMGDLLSFPLLCLTNYIALKHAIKRKVPVKINGDDIVFRCTPAEYERWSTSIGESGLVLSKGKTMVSNRYFSLNSTFFCARASQPRLVPVVRAKPIFSSFDAGECDHAAVTDRLFSSMKGLWPQAKTIVKEMFFRNQRKIINSLPGSLNGDFQVRADVDLLRRTNLLEKELDYTWHPAMVSTWVGQIGQPRKGIIPEGWKREGVVNRDRAGIGYASAKVRHKAPFGWEEMWGKACIQHAWTHDLHNEKKRIGGIVARRPHSYELGKRMLRSMAKSSNTLPLVSSEWRAWRKEDPLRKRMIQEIQVRSKAPMREKRPGVWWGEEGSIEQILWVERLKWRQPAFYLRNSSDATPWRGNKK